MLVSANQIGSALAVFSYNVDDEVDCVINAVLVEASGEQDGYEACLSMPEIGADRDGQSPPPSPAST